MREKFGEPADGMASDAGEDVFEPDEGIDTDPLTRGQEAPQHAACATASASAISRGIRRPHRGPH